MMMGDAWTHLGSTVAALFFFWSMYRNYFPAEIHDHILKFAKKITLYFYPYIKITFREFDGENWFESRKAFTAIERYLSFNSSAQSKRLKAKVFNESEAVVLSMDDHEAVTDEFEGVKLWWASKFRMPNSQTISFYPVEDGKRSFVLTFHKKHRDIVTHYYLKHVLKEGKDIAMKQRKRKLFSNTPKSDNYYGKKLWSHVVFEHPASFETLAMESKKKKEIIDDLVTFSKSKDYYAKIGKAWKRGYLLYGPPGTGKSTMIAAMANFLNYDVYDLELTAVKDNSQLRRLLIDTSSKSIIVIEDIDCSLDLTGQREKKADEDAEDEEGNKANVKDIEKKMKNNDEKSSKLTLSGLLNCIDGLWSTCGEERVFVFTTNYVEKLDPALIRRGRMDKHIELSYCCFESFKVLANNYWNLESHQLFPAIQDLLGETKVTPADVAENLMPKSTDDDATVCLGRLIKAIETDKEEGRQKADQEKMKEENSKADEEEKKKQES